MSNRVELPFIRGIQAAGDPNADGESGKLDLAHNVHARPEFAGALHRRPGVTAGLEVRSKFTRVGRIDGRLAIAQQNSFKVEDSSGNAHTVLNHGLLSELSSKSLATDQNEVILGSGYAEDSDGNAIAVFTVIGQKGTASSIQYHMQVRYNGVWSTRLSLNVSGLVADAGARRICVFESQANTDRWVVFYGAANAINAIEVLKSDGGTFTPAVVVPSAILWDVVRYSSGWMVLYQSTVTNRLIVRNITTGYSTSAMVGVTAAGPISPTAAGLVWVGGVDLHVWHGGYAADSNTLYCHFIPWSGAAVLQMTLVNALDDTSTGNAIVAMSVGGGSAVRNRVGTATEAASYCYIVGGAGLTQRFGRICRATVVGVEAGRTFTGAIYPQARLWTGADWFGARVFGVYGTIFGVWEMFNHPTFSLTENTRPMVYHSVTLAEAITYDLVPRSNSMWVSSDGNEAKAILWNRSASHIQISHCGWGDTTGQVVESNGFQIVLGGVPRYWDGSFLHGVGIPTAPVYSLVPTATGTMAAGTYVYALCWRFVDANGRSVRSPVTLQTVVVPANGHVNIPVNPSSRVLDARGYFNGAGPVVAELEVYRTDPNGTQLRKARGYMAQFGLNVYSSSFDSFTEDTGAAIFDGEVLYTTLGGASELVSTALESTSLLRGYSDRAIWVGPLFPDVVSYTKTLRQGRILEPNQALTLVLPQHITGLAYQDGNVYAFSADNCWGFVPTFADDTGNGNTSVDPVPLATGIGCTQPRSIIETPVAVFFIGPRGFYAIERGGGAPNFIGADVEPYFLDYPTCQGVAHNPRTHEVAWVMTNGSDHRVIVVNYLSFQWFTWRIGDPATAQAGELTTLGGGVTCLSSGFVFGERGTTTNAAAYACSDNATVDTGTITFAQIPIDIRSRDIHPGGFGATCRVRNISVDCLPTASSVLRVSESHDRGTTWSTEYSLATTDGNQPPVYQFAVQRTRGVRFRLRTIAGEIAPLTLAGVSLSYSTGRKAYTSSSRRRG